MITNKRNVECNVCGKIEPNEYCMRVHQFVTGHGIFEQLSKMNADNTKIVKEKDSAQNKGQDHD